MKIEPCMTNPCINIDPVQDTSLKKYKMITAADLRLGEFDIWTSCKACQVMLHVLKN
jgi:hypothetical protein